MYTRSGIDSPKTVHYNDNMYTERFTADGRGVELRTQFSE